MKRHQSRSLWFLVQSVSAWAIALGLFLLIHRVGTTSTAGWNPDDLSMLMLWAVASLLFGTVFWLINIVTESTALRSQSFGLLILMKSFAMLVALIIYFMIRALTEFLLTETPAALAWAHGIDSLFSPLAGVIFLYVALTSLALNFVRQMSALVGQRVLINLLLGKYRHPRVETRIFMFLDLEGSTTIAERLGHQEFCRLIQESFRDLASVAIRRNVEIYQYVGDEAILTWIPELGLEDGNCVRVSFDLEDQINRRSSFYREQFDVIPRFKAGVNIGPVTVAEIGVDKRDISYLSDVLNTAARLESMCRQHDARLLITEDLMEALDKAEDLRYQSVGELQLRGRREMVGVYRVDTRSA
jgi:adenylate cyclase